MNITFLSSLSLSQHSTIHIGTMSKMQKTKLENLLLSGLTTSEEAVLLLYFSECRPFALVFVQKYALENYDTTVCKIFGSIWCSSAPQ